MEKINNGIIVDGKVYVAEMHHPDCLAMCGMCDLSNYCEGTDREVCAAIASPTDCFRYSPELTERLNNPDLLNGK